jgi:hypothetical protein
MVDFNDRRKEIKPRPLSERYPMLFDPSTDAPKVKESFVADQYDELSQPIRPSEGA